jgi:hypothetical protein
MIKLEESRTPMVGPFFFIDNNLYDSAEYVTEVPSIRGYSDGSDSHCKFWAFLQGIYPELRNVDYDYWPRGRVVYDGNSDRYNIIVDRDINDKKHIDEIIDTFYLPRNKCVVNTDEHYQCHICNKNYANIAGNFKPGEYNR